MRTICFGVVIIMLSGLSNSLGQEKLQPNLADKAEMSPEFDPAMFMLHVLGKGIPDSLELSAKQRIELKEALNSREAIFREELDKIIAVNPSAQSIDGRPAGKIMMEKVQRKIESILLPNQLQKIKQAAMASFREYSTILDVLKSKWTRTKLKISDEQMDAIVDRASTESRTIDRKIKQLMKGAEKSVLSELTDEQRRKYSELVGQ